MTLDFEKFDEIVPRAAEVHPMTWCVRDQSPRLTMRLDGKECCSCPDFVLNKGVCDPL